MHIDKVVDGLKRGGKLVCHRCNVELDKDKWVSEWDSGNPELHYKSAICECGKKNWVQVDFQGSGHDRHLQERDKVIASEVNKVPGDLPKTLGN
jgi:hypothetical protein